MIKHKFRDTNVKDAVFSGLRPKQKLPKSKKDKEWGNSSARWYRDACRNAIDPIECLRLYRMANGDIDIAEYSFVTNPLNTDNPLLKGYPARMRNYDIITPNLNTIMADKKARMFLPIVIAKNSQFEEIKQDKYLARLKQEMQIEFINEIIKLGIPFGEEQQSRLDQLFEEIKSIPDLLSKLGSDTIDYMDSTYEISRKLRKGFYDFLVTAMVFTYKDINKDKYYYQTLSPMYCGYLASNNIDFVEDGEAFRATYYMTINEIYDRFQDMEGFKEVEDYLESQSDSYGTEIGGNRATSPFYATTDAIQQQHLLFSRLGLNSGPKEFEQGIRVDHVTWRSYEEVGKVPFQNEFGEIEMIEVDTSYKPWSEVIDKRWEEQIYECYIIDDRFFLGMGEIPFYRGSNAKHPYNGRNYHGRHVTPQSIVKKGEPFQKTVNIVRYNVERILSKNMDKILPFPLSMIPNKEDWDEKTVIYYAQALSVLFFDDTKVNLNALQAMRGIDMGLSKYIIESYTIIQQTKQEWDDISGISPQRKANIDTNAGKGITQLAIQRSLSISEELFTQYEEFEEREYTGALELSKYLFYDGIKEHFVRSTGEKAFLNIFDPDTFVNTDFKVFVKNSSRELQKLDELKANAQAFAQNQAVPSLVAKIIDSDNYQELMDYMTKMERDLERRQTEQAQLERESVERVEQLKSEDVNRELDFKYYKVDADNRNDIEVALIRDTEAIVAQEVQAGATDNNTATNSTSERMQQVQDNLLKLMELKVKEKDIESKERIAKEKNETALKNKVVGETSD